MISHELKQRILSSIILIPLCVFFINIGGILFNIFLLMLFSLSVYEWIKMNNKIIFHFCGIIFLSLSFLSVFILRDNFNEKGELLIFFLILIGISTDFGGYLFGKSFKGPKLTKISPNKTYSGVFGSYIVSIFFTYILLQNLPFFFELKSSLNINLFLLIFILSSISQFGDLVISYFKRLSSLKDTGKIIPGHGGILDRIDGLIFIFPSFYFFNLFFKII
jgi:phosphatidate cytidylyltransferase